MRSFPKLTVFCSAIGEVNVSEHTPGPWHFDGVCQIVEVERPHMRVCFLPSDHAEYASSKANGRLISAAPDMLAALKAVVAVADRRTDEFDAARAAIAKATQVSPAPHERAER